MRKNLIHNTELKEGFVTSPKEIKEQCKFLLKGVRPLLISKRMELEPEISNPDKN